MNFEEWIAQLFGTLIGTGVGFGLAMWWDRRKEQESERRDHGHTIESILLELREILGRLDIAHAEVSPTASSPESVEVDFSLPFLSRSAFDAAVHSGKLTLLRPDLQVRLSTIYEQVRIMRLHIDNAFTSYAHGTTVDEHQAVISNATGYLLANSKAFREDLQDMCKALEEARDTFVLRT